MMVDQVQEQKTDGDLFLHMDINRTASHFIVEVNKGDLYLVQFAMRVCLSPYGDERHWVCQERRDKEESMSILLEL
jgi:hypothetical protein